MKKVLIAATLLFAAFIIGCKGKSGGNPTEVLAAFFDAMAKKDFTTAKSLATPESQAMFSLMEMAGKEAKNDMNFNKEKVEFGTAIIDGDNAKVPIKDKGKNETVNFPMKKINGDWKVAFDKTSIMGMAADKMKEEGVNIGDSLTNVMKNINLDSMKDEVNKAMKEANINGDSMAKEINKAMKEVNPNDIKKAMEALKK